MGGEENEIEIGRDSGGRGKEGKQSEERLWEVEYKWAIVEMG